MKKVLSLILLWSSLFSQNEITVEEYKYINKTSTSLQTLIYEYHDFASQGDRTFIFDLESIKDGSNEGSGEYKSSFETADGYKGAQMNFYKLKGGGESFGVIGRQLGVSSDKVNPKTHDYAFMGRKTYFDDALDVLIGLNMHDEPEYETIGGKEYFTDLYAESSFRLVYSINLYNANLSMLINEDYKAEQTILSYKFDTNAGLITTKLLLGTEPFKYYDTYLQYNNHKIPNKQNFYINLMVKHRTLKDSSLDYANGVVASYIEVEKSIFKLLRFSFGISSTSEYSQEVIKGNMFKVGLYSPRNEKGTQMGFYYGSSRNYYPDIQDFRMFDQNVDLFGVDLNF